MLCFPQYVLQYFADMVSKSANYCHASQNTPDALLAVCEVALGNMYECKSSDSSLNKVPILHMCWHTTQPKSVHKVARDSSTSVPPLFVRGFCFLFQKTLPDGKHSTFGVGRTIPKREHNKVLDNGAVIPLGPGVDSGVKDTSLLYNEYIVYDTAQLNMKYLLHVEFKFGARRF